MESGNLKQVIELAGIAVLLFSVIFLGYELKRSNDIAEAEASE